MGISASKSVKVGIGDARAYVYGSMRGLWTGLRFSFGGLSFSVGKNVTDLFKRKKAKPPEEVVVDEDEILEDD